MEIGPPLPPPLPSSSPSPPTSPPLPYSCRGAMTSHIISSLLFFFIGIFQMASKNHGFSSFSFFLFPFSPQPCLPGPAVGIKEESISSGGRDLFCSRGREEPEGPSSLLFPFHCRHFPVPPTSQKGFPFFFFPPFCPCSGYCNADLGTLFFPPPFFFLLFLPDGLGKRSSSTS